AALAYSLQTPRSGAHGQAVLRDAGGPGKPLPIKEQTVLVYDLGGGTFDVTLVRLSPRRFESLAIEGDVRLGGKDWDDRIVDFVAGKFLHQFGQDPRGNPQALAALSAAAERAKRTLSKLNQANISCMHAGQLLTTA